MSKPVDIRTPGAQHSPVLHNSTCFSPTVHRPRRIRVLSNLVRSLREGILMRLSYWSVDEQQGAQFRQSIQCGDHGTYKATCSCRWTHFLNLLKRVLSPVILIQDSHSYDIFPFSLPPQRFSPYTLLEKPASRTVSLSYRPSHSNEDSHTTSCIPPPLSSSRRKRQVRFCASPVF